MLSEQAVFQLSTYLLILGALIVVLVILFAVLLLRLRYWRKSASLEEFVIHDLRHWLFEPPGRRDTATFAALVGAAYAEHLSRRNEFWMSYGQTTVAVLLLVVITILLLTRTIEPDAGLPILSGIAGFALAKTTTSATTQAPRGPTQPE